MYIINSRVAGTIGAVLTCPLEVVKTRFQSSYINYNPINPPQTHSTGCSTHFNPTSTLQANHANFCTTTCTPTPTTNNLSTVNTIILKNHNLTKNRNFPKLGAGIFLQMK